MNLLEIKTSGKICIFLSKVQTLTIEEYLNKAKANYYNAMNEEGFERVILFISKNLSRDEKRLLRYVM